MSQEIKSLYPCLKKEYFHLFSFWLEDKEINENIVKISKAIIALGFQCFTLKISETVF